MDGCHTGGPRVRSWWPRERAARYKPDWNLLEPRQIGSKWGGNKSTFKRYTDICAESARRVLSAVVDAEDSRSGFSRLAARFRRVSAL